jgi:hypothetical protein
MMPKAINSRIAVCRSHSLTRRCTAGSERRRRSGRGGKSGPGPPAVLALGPTPRRHPDQKTAAPHEQHGRTRKSVPAPPLIVIPAQCRFCFLLLLLPPVAAGGVLAQALHRGAGGEIPPEILPVPVLPSARALPKQPPARAGALALHPPTPQGEKLRAPPAWGALPPRAAVPGPPGVADQPLRAPAHRSVRAPAQDHPKMGPHGPPVALLALR